MKIFKLQGLVKISIYTEVEAETLEEAIALSKDRSIETYKFGEHLQPQYAWVSDEFDGEPTEIELV